MTKSFQYLEGDTFKLGPILSSDLPPPPLPPSGGGGDMYKADNLLGLGDYPSARINMGLEIGVNVQPVSALFEFPQGPVSLIQSNNGKILYVNSSVTLSQTIGEGFNCLVKNISPSLIILVNEGSETTSGLNSIGPNESAFIVKRTAGLWDVFSGQGPQGEQGIPGAAGQGLENYSIVPNAPVYPPLNPANTLSQQTITLGANETFLFHHNATSALSRTVQSYRNANYSGDGGKVNGNVYAYTEIQSGANGKEWAGTFVNRNIGGGFGENVGAYGQTWAWHTGTKSWGGVSEARFFGGGSPTNCWGHETDVLANINYTGNNLVGHYIVAGKADSAGPTPLIYAGQIVEAQFNNNSSAELQNAYIAGDFNQRGGVPLKCKNAFNSYIQGTNVWWDRSITANGVAMTGTYSTAAYTMNSMSCIAFDNELGAHIKMRFNPSTNAIEFTKDGVVKNSLSMA